MIHGQPAILVRMLIIPLWGLLVCVGMFELYRYENTPNATASAPDQYPQDLRLVGKQPCPILLVFVHPLCPCSGSTIDKLERLVARLEPRILVSVVFWHPSDVGPRWHETALWRKAGNLRRVNVIDDTDAVMTRRFGVATSGQVLLYDSLGKLQFSGGITSARGHAGDNAGSDAVLSIVRTGNSPVDTTPRCCEVFGCSLYESKLQAPATESKR